MGYDRLLEPLDIDDPVVFNTPWDEYELGGAPVWVKREDMSCPKPGPSFSKIRGLYKHLLSISKDTNQIGILDTIHSKAGWGTAYIGHLLGLEVYDFFPVYKSDRGAGKIREQQRVAASLGAILIPMRATAGYVLFPQARSMLADMTHGNGYMLPVGLKLSESVESTCREVVEFTPPELLTGSWVVSISSGTMAAGVMKGLAEVADPGLELILHMGYSRKVESASDYIESMAGVWWDNTYVVDEGYDYKDKVEHPCPFPCNPYYDLKAWKWLDDEIGILKPPVVFWNIGE